MSRAGLALVIFYGLAVSARGQGYSPAEAPSRMTLPKGLEARLVASEPLVRQPVAMEFDDRGRLWVIQYLQYPNPAGLKRVQVDRFSRTRYDRVPEPPPHGPRGADRITILQDTEGDGVADAGRDFVDGLNLATGLAFGYGGVFVLNVPYLLFYPDRDGDDAPDADPKVLLTGFGMEDAHSVANSLMFGPDGWLYGCQGSTVTARIRGVEFQQGVWRYHPRSKQFELFCEGGGNSWGLDFDRQGRLLYSTNHGGYCMLHGVQGGYFWKQFGKHGALHNPFALGYFDHVPHANFQGGHVTVGGIVYQADLLPDLRDKYVGGDLLGHAVYWHHIAPRGSSFQSAHGGSLLAAGDTWFATSDVAQGPDGAIYVADFHDQRTAHPDPDAEWDRSNGRIYRLAPTGYTSPATPDLNQLSSRQLADELHNANAWLARRALRILAERRDPAAAETLRTAALTEPDADRSLRTLWGVHACGGLDEGTATSLLASPHEHVRSWTIRLWLDRVEAGELPESAAFAQRLDRLAETDPSVHVRCQLAVTARRLPSEVALPIIHSLLLRDQDGADPYLPLLLWWAVERHSLAAAEQVLARFARPAAWQSALTRQAILGRLTRRYAATGEPGGLAACSRLLQAAPGDTERALIVAAMDEGLRDAAGAPAESRGSLFQTPSSADPPVAQDPSAIDLLKRVWRPDTQEPAVLRVAALLGQASALDRALFLALDDEQPLPLRLTMLAVAADIGPAEDLEAGWRAFDREQPEAWQLAWLSLTARIQDTAISQELLSRYDRLSPAVQVRARDVLASRPSGAIALLTAVDAGEISGEGWPAEQLRALAAHHEPEIDALVRKHWGNIQPDTPEEKLAVVRRLSNDLRAAPGDKPRGKELFKKHCAICHQLFGEGARVGPELTAANRQDQQYLLVNLIDPSAQIRKEYLSYVAQTVDGRVLTGLLVEQTAGSVTLLDARNQRLTLPRNELEALEESPLSLMPERLLLDLKPQELRDLFSYLQASGPN